MTSLPKFIFVLPVWLVLVVLGQQGSYYKAYGVDVPFISGGIAISVEGSPSKISSGSIVSFENGNYTLSTKPYQTTLFGVVATDPAISLLDNSLAEAILVSTAGEVYTKVNGQGGAIKKGDLITSSTVPGIGMKADKSGQMLGTALEDFTPATSEAVAQILVAVNVRTVLISEGFQKDLIELFRSGVRVPFLTPLTSLRYILAFTVTLIAFFLGFLSFSRISASSVQALGRNPLASRTIKLSIAVNFILTAVIVLVGLAVAYLMLTL